MTSQPPYQRWRGRAGRVRRKITDLARPAAPEPTRPRRRSAPGTAPDAHLEPTNIGSVMDEGVLRAKKRLRVGSDPDYDLLYENFDVLHYLLQAPHLLDDPDVDVIEHFLKFGREERLDPHPDFSMSEYVDRYPGRTTRVRNPYLYYLKYGRDLGDIADPAPSLRRIAASFDMSPEDLAQAMKARRDDLRDRFLHGRLGEVFAKAAEIEPLIGATWSEIANPHLIPISRRVVADETHAIHEAQKAAGFRRARLVFVINRPRWGGGRRMEGHLAHALAAHVDPSDIVVIYTDDSGELKPNRFPAGVREIDFAPLVHPLPAQAAQHALIMLLRSFGADAIVNINSGLFYRALRPFGQALMTSERVFLCFLCNEQTGMGTWQGWSLGYFYRSFEHVAGVITDSDFLANELTETYRVAHHHRERLHVFRAPVDPELPVVSQPHQEPGRRPQVFWAGRWDRQKRVDLALEVARQMPDVDFRMWGESVMSSGHQAQAPENVRLEGAYAHISQIPLAEADAWLYTSGWDGVPSQLLEVAMTGIPIVGTLVGGTDEVLHEAESWPVAVDEGAEAYVASIRAVLADPQAARDKSSELRERMLRERNAKDFATQAADLLLPNTNVAEGGQ